MIHYCAIAPEAPATPIAERKNLFRGAKRALVSVLSSVGFLVSVAASLGAQAPATAAPAAAQPTRNMNWLGDKRSFSVGDILRVSVDEYTAATANKGAASDASRNRKMSIDIAPPSVGASAMGPIDGSVGSGDAGQSHQRGQANNSNSYVGELAVRVIAVTKEGLLQVRGTKMIDVDKNKQEMTLTGFVRPQDVNSQDMVISSSIADVQLAYKSKGGLGKPKNGIITKLVGIFWP